MIDFGNLVLEIDKKYSFVGVKKCDETLYFYLPKGFEDQIVALDTFDSKRDLFFLFYKILSVFRDICIEKGYIDITSQFMVQDRDGVINTVDGSTVEEEQKYHYSENIFYSKLDLIGSLLNAYDEPKILALAYRLGITNKFDPSQIHRYLDRATYLENHAAYVDQMILPRQMAQFESTDIVAMYCYLFTEIKQQLGEETPTEIRALSEKFRQHYLGSQDSLFDEETYESVMVILKDSLELIDNNTAIKDADYWQYYEPIELFLYGDWSQSDDGEIWGVKNFHSVWESMCLEYIVKEYQTYRILQIDGDYLRSEVLQKVKSVSHPIDLSNTFRLKNISLKPDIILLATPKHLEPNLEKTYSVSGDNWDDYGYKISLNIKLDGKNKSIKMAKIGQEKGVKTIDLLRSIASSQNGVIELENQINSDIFYSFWDLPECIDVEVINEMYCFNHLFYLATMQKGILSWSKFFKEILEAELNLDNNLYAKNKRYQALEYLFRYSSLESLRSQFDSFVRQFFYLGIIDAKYLSIDYFTNPDNKEEIKSRSVRKQFVYEYLLQRELSNNKDGLNHLNVIKSFFWVPKYDSNSTELILESPTFMDNYISLKNVNFAVVAKSYLEDYQSPND